MIKTRKREPVKRDQAGTTVAERGRGCLSNDSQLMSPRSDASPLRTEARVEAFES